MQAMGKEHGVVERTVWSWPQASLDPLWGGEQLCAVNRAGSI